MDKDMLSSETKLPNSCSGESFDALDSFGVSLAALESTLSSRDL